MSILTNMNKIFPSLLTLYSTLHLLRKENYLTFGISIKPLNKFLN